MTPPPPFTPASGPPYLVFAQFCTLVLTEKEGPSLIRVMNAVTAHVPEGFEGEPSVATQFVVALTGLSEGAHELTIWHAAEAADEWERMLTTTITSRGGDGNYQLFIPVDLKIVRPGLHRVSVSVDGTELTRVPVRLDVKYVPAPRQGPDGGPLNESSWSDDAQ